MKNKIVVLNSDTIGRGDESLGHVLLANFLRQIAERPDKPAAIICWSDSVRLVCAGAAAFEAQEHLRQISAQGVKVYGCKTCLEHYGLLDSVVVGEVGGMPTFVEMMSKHEVLTL